MLNKIGKVLQPQYVDKFQCIGSACEDSCCIGWRVEIDKDTYKRYRKCSDETLFEVMKCRVTRRRTGATERNYAKIKLNAKGRCPFLDSESLCSIQRKLGEDYLSVTCATYPRVINVLNGVAEKSLTLSCPEAARLVLLNSEPMAFIEREEPLLMRDMNGKLIDTHDYQILHKPQRYFWELRIFIISLLQNSSYPLWQRLVVLGLFCRQLDRLVGEGQVYEIPQLIGRYIGYLEQGEFKDDLNSIPKELTIQMQLMKEIADERIFTGVQNKRFLECFTEFLLGINYTAEAAKEEISEVYAAAHDKYYYPFIEANGHLLENYLVNYVFKNLFPINGHKHIFENYVMLIVHYAMIKLLLIGLAGFFKESFSADHVVKLIQSFSKTVEHNDTYLKKIAELLRVNQFNTMPYMAILIKN